MNAEEIYDKACTEEFDIEIIKEAIKKAVESKDLTFLIEMAKLYVPDDFNFPFFGLIPPRWRYNREIILERASYLEFDSPIESEFGDNYDFPSNALDIMRKRYGNDKALLSHLAEAGSMMFVLKTLISPELCKDSEFIAQMIRIGFYNFEKYIYTDETRHNYYGKENVNKSGFLKLLTEEERKEKWKSQFPNIPYDLEIDRALIEISGFRDEYPSLNCGTHIEEDVKVNNRRLYGVRPIDKTTSFQSLAYDLKRIRKIREKMESELARLQVIEEIDNEIERIYELERKLTHQRQDLLFRGYTEEQIDQ